MFTDVKIDAAVSLNKYQGENIKNFLKGIFFFFNNGAGASCSTTVDLVNHLRAILHEYSSLANGPKKRGSIGLIKTSSAYSRKLSF